MNAPIIIRAAALAVLLAAATGCSGSESGSGPANGPLAPAADPRTVDPQTGGDGVRRSPVVAGRPARVFVMAGFGAHCESLAAPVITVTEPPTKGSVTFEPGQETTVNTSASGSCIGQRVTGTGIYYTARADQTGADRFTVHAEVGGDATDRTFAVEIVQ